MGGERWRFRSHFVPHLGFPFVAALIEAFVDPLFDQGFDYSCDKGYVSLEVPDEVESPGCYL
jgi:hypothetical protein